MKKPLTRDDMGAFRNGLRVEHINESLTQEPATTMEDITTQMKCYIRVGKSNT